MINVAALKPKLKDLRVPTALEEGVDTPDGQGGVNRVWTARTGVIWTSDTPRAYKDVGEGGQVTEIVRHWIMCRYDPTIVPLVRSDFRWRFNGDYGIWYIETAIDPFDTRQWWLAICTETPL